VDGGGLYVSGRNGTELDNETHQQPFRRMCMESWEWFCELMMLMMMMMILGRGGGMRWREECVVVYNQIVPVASDDVT
jgi:hypothetical protein